MKKSLLDFIQSGIFLTRRSLLKFAAAGSALLVLGIDKAKAAVEWLSPRLVQKSAPSTIDADVKVVHSVCLSCNARCGVRAVVENGTLVNHSGNPYHPYNSRFEPVPYNTPLKDTLKLPSPVCGKSQGMPNYAYSPYRILKPLKRAGERGSGKFEPIEWDRMIEEIAAGGRLFAHLGEDCVVPGIKELNSDAPIDPDAPELGVNRKEGGRNQGRSHERRVCPRFWGQYL